MLQSFKRYRALGRAERWLLVRAFVWLSIMDIALRVVGFRRLVQWHQAPARAEGSVSPVTLRRARQYAHWLELASRHHVVRTHCLQRSLVLHHWLRQEGLPSELRIGVRKEDRALHAHAWVELGGQVVNDSPAAVAAFTPLAPAEVQPATRGQAGRPIVGPAAGIDAWRGP